MFTVKFGSTSDNPSVLNKSYTFTISKNMKPLGEVSILNPIFIIAYDSDIIGCNYAEISDWGKFYFVTTSIMTDGRMRVELNVDYLTSNKADIEKLNATIIRTGSLNKPTYVPDDSLPIEQSRSRLSIKEFSGGPHVAYEHDVAITAAQLIIHTI